MTALTGFKILINNQDCVILERNKTGFWAETSYTPIDCVLKDYINNLNNCRLSLCMSGSNLLELLHSLLF